MCGVQAAANAQYHYQIGRAKGMPMSASRADRPIEVPQLPVSVGTLRDIFAAHGVTMAYVFGSRARGDARPESDLDLLVHFDEATADRYFGLLADLENVLPVPVDVATRIEPAFARYIAPDLIRIL